MIIKMAKIQFTIVVVVGLLLGVSSLGLSSMSCGYSACPRLDPKKLNLHILPHSHDDVGWLSTADGYYNDKVQHIISNVAIELEKDSKRKFTQVEMYYFHRWWAEQNSTVKSKVQKLVFNGQFVFIGGGWVVNDEPVAHYNNIIDQMSLGLRFLHEEFQQCGLPKISWQVDSFGHSKEMTALLAQMGFDGHVTNRAVSPKGEFVWQGSADLGAKSEMFCSNLHNHYHPPPGFDYEGHNDDLNEQNKDHKADEFVKLGQQWNKDYNNLNNVLMTMGADMAYVNAQNWYRNMDLLIETINARHTDVHAFYSTPDCYFHALNQLNKTFEVRERDYLNLWVGFYTSRPTLKRADRVTNNFLQAAKQLEVLTVLDRTKNDVYLDEIRNEVAILQHHDAITGTSPQDTADDYAMRIYNGLRATYPIIAKAFDRLQSKSTSNHRNEYSFCDKLNITECSVSEKSDNFALHLYNPLGHTVEEYVRLPVHSASSYEVYQPNGTKLPDSQVAIVPVAKFIENQLPERSPNSAKFERVFKTKLGPLSLSTFLIKKVKSHDDIFGVSETISGPLKGDGFQLHLDPKTGQIESIELNNQNTNIKHRLNQQFMFYQSMAGIKNKVESGSYQFCPNGNAKNVTESDKSVKLLATYSDGMLQEVHQTFSDYVHQTIRVYRDQQFVEFDWVVGPLPFVNQTSGREVIIRFESDLENNHTFFTDANGRQMVRRVYDPKQRSCSDDPIPANWYPINTKAFIQDPKSKLQLSVLTDRTQGGSSLNNGQLELMVHRRLTKSGPGGGFVINELDRDGKGLVIRGKHYLHFGPTEQSMEPVRNLGQKLFMSPIIAFSQFDGNVENYRQNFETNIQTLINSGLPENVHLLSLETWSNEKVLIRLENFYQKQDSVQNKTELNKAAVVDLRQLFNLKIEVIEETTLTGVETIKSSVDNRLKWKSKRLSAMDDIQDDTEDDQLGNIAKDTEDKDKYLVTIEPQQIRTFLFIMDNRGNKLEEKCHYKWVMVENSEIPANAFPAGIDDNQNSTTTLYVCRATVDGDLIAGKANNHLKCRVSRAGKEIKRDNHFEVLVVVDNSSGGSAQWIPRHDGDPVPSRAILVGKTATNDSTYIGRCPIPKSEVVGKIHHKFYYPYGGTEHHDCHNHEVLICN